MKLNFPIMSAPDDAHSGSLGGSPDGSAVSVTADNPFDTTTSTESMPSLPPRVGEPEKAPETLHQKVEPVKPVVAPPTPPSLTAEQISELAAQTAIRVNRQSQPPPQAPAKPAPQPISDAEFNQRFGVVTADAKTYTDIFGFAPEKPEQIQALNNFGQNLVRQTMRMVQFMQTQELGKVKTELTGQVSPLLRSHQESVEREMRNEFYTQNPDLKDFGALIEEITAGLQVQARQSKTPLFQGTVAEQKAAAYNFVAARARTLLGRSAPSGQAAPQQVTDQQQTQQPQRRMTPMSMGGQSGGAGAATVNSRSSNDAKAIFG